MAKSNPEKIKLGQKFLDKDRKMWETIGIAEGVHIKLKRLGDGPMNYTRTIMWDKWPGDLESTSDA